MAKICASIGTEDTNSLKKLVSDSFADGADFFEVRFDYIDASKMGRALEVVNDYKEKSIFTCRAPNEGGKYLGPEKDRIATLGRLAEYRPMLLDIEYRTMLANKDLMDSINCDTLISWHNFVQTPSCEEFDILLRNMKKYSNNIKIVTMANGPKDNSNILHLYENETVKSDTKLIAFCMGEYGRESRVLCAYAGAPFTYASIEEAVAPGQLTVKQMRKIYDRLGKEIPELNDYTKCKDIKLSDVTKIINDVSKQH